MVKDELRKQLCAGYCSFYKPEKDEELACQGYYVVGRLLDEGKYIPAKPEKILLSVSAEDALFQLICRKCPFFVADCDFASWKRGETPAAAREELNPCGGLLCLEHCIGSAAMDIEDINRVI